MANSMIPFFLHQQPYCNRRLVTEDPVKVFLGGTYVMLSSLPVASKGPDKVKGSAWHPTIFDGPNYILFAPGPYACCQWPAQTLLHKCYSWVKAEAFALCMGAAR